MNAGWKLCHGTEVAVKRLQNNDQVYQGTEMAVKHLPNNDQVYQGTEMMDQNQIQDP